MTYLLNKLTRHTFIKINVQATLRCIYFSPTIKFVFWLMSTLFTVKVHDMSGKHGVYCLSLLANVYLRASLHGV